LAILATITSGMPVSAATYYWDQDGNATGNNVNGVGLGGTGVWDTTTPSWWNGTNDVLWPNSFGDSAVFSGTAGTVTLDGSINAGSLLFQTDGYRLTGDTLTLGGAATVNVGAFNTATIDSVLAGTSGLLKTGGGTLRLTNSGNTFSGDIAIGAGSLVVTDAAQLGTGTSTIAVAGFAFSNGVPGYSGGSLVLQGGVAGMTFNRDVSIAGRGPGVFNGSGGLISIGNNTITGDIVLAGTGSEARAMSVFGNTTLAGTLQLGTGQGAVFSGNGNWIISGQVTGFDAATQDRFIKSGSLIGSTLWLQNPNNNFAQPLRLDSGTVRVTTPGALGTSLSNLALDFNNGGLEVRSDDGDFTSRNFFVRGATANIFVDHNLGSSVLNNTVQFGTFSISGNTTVAMTGRNGYNLLLGSGAVLPWGAGGLAFSNVSSGTLTINASVNHASETTARNVAFTTSGEIIFKGDILQVAGGAAVGISKANTGMLILQGTGASNATGPTTISAGTITASSFNQLPTGDLLIGNATTTSGAFNYVGAGETNSKRITINTTTANAYLNSNGTGALILNGPFATVSTGAAATKTFVLGGTNTADNEIASAIFNPAAGSMQLQKIGSGTWVLSGANTFAGTATTGVIVSGGTLKIKDTFATTSRDVIADTNSVIFNTDLFSQMAGGTLQYVGTAGSASSETLSALIATSGLGTIQALPGTGTGASATLNFTTLGARSNGATINVLNTGTVNIGGTAGFLNAGTFFNNADFAYSGAGTTLRAPIYGGLTPDAGFVTAGAALTATSHNLVTSDTTTGAISINSLKISGAFTVDQTGLLTINTGANTAGGIIADGGASTISGTGITTAGSGDLVAQVTSGSQLTLAAPITSTMTGGLTKSGAGTLVLQGSQAYAGATTINQGTILIDANSRLGGSVNNNLTIRQDGTLDLFGNTVGVGALNGSGSIVNTDVVRAFLTVGNNNQAGYFTGSIAGDVQLIKTGSGNIAVTGLNSFTGATVLTGGVLAVNNLANIGVNSAIGKGNATDDFTNAASLIFNGGTLQYTGATSVIYQNTQTPSINIDRLFTMAANGAIDSSGSFGAPTLTRAANHAALIFGNDGDIAFIGTGARTLTLQGDSIGDNRLNPRLIDNTNGGVLNVTKSGSGLWILGNTSNGYTGTTTINGGALQAVDGASLPTDSNLFLSGGVFQSFGTFDRTLGTGSDQYRFSTTASSGFSSSTAKLTVDFGVLNDPVWGSTTNFLAGNSLILNSNTALSDVEVKGNFGILAGIESSTISLTTANSNSTITVAGGGTTAGLTIGQMVSGLNIPAGSFITSITGNTTFTINQNTNATGAATGTGSILGGGYRQVQVDDNGSTNLDFATISGIMSGTGGISKTGGGSLILGNANTYSGNTMLRQGNLYVTSIGAAGATSSSLGTNVGGGALEIGNPNATDTVNLMYVGSGETATRRINIIGTTGTRRLDSSGSGALVLTNLANSTATSINTTGGAKTLELRGTNVDANMITSVLADNGGALTITKADAGTWILNPTSTNLFTGALNANGGSLGLTADGIGNAASLSISNGSVFAYGGDLTATRPVILVNNATAGFIGSNNITISGNLTKQAGANDQTVDNTLDAGKALTISGNFVNLETAAATRSINWRGTGATVFNGTIQNNSGTSLTRFDVRLDNTGSMTLNGNTAADPLGFTGGLLFGNGTLILGSVGALGPAANNFIFDGGVLTATVDLSGANKITNRVFLQGDPMTIAGNQNIEFGAASGATFELNGSRQLINNLDPSKLLTVSGTVNLTTDTNARTLTLRGTGNTTISGVIANGGSGASGVTMAGLGDLRITTAATATGALTATRGRIILSGSGAWTTGTLALNPNAVLRIENAGSTARLPTGAVAGNAGILQFSGAATQSTGNLALNLGQTSITTDSTLSLTFASVTVPNSGSSLNLLGVSNIGSTNKVIFTGALPTGLQIGNISPRIFISGDDFATYIGNTNGVERFTAYNNTNDLNAAAATDTLNLTASAGITLNKTVNALKINGSGLLIGGSTRVTLTLAAAAILNTGGDNSLNTTMVTFGGNTGYIQTKAGTTLTVNSSLLGTAGIAKVQAGALTLNTQNYYTGTTNVLGGTLTLNGGLNTIFPNQTLNMQYGGTLDLNGNTQWTGVLNDPGAASGNGGIITSSTGFGTYVTNMSGTATAMTQINGNVNFVRLNGNTLTLGSAQTYSGSTTLLGGTLTLQDEATILNSSVIDLSTATLVLGNNSGLQIGNADRIGDAIPINLRDGTFQFNGRVNTASTERLGLVTSAEGANTIALNTGGTGTAGAYASADVTFANFIRSAGSTVNFTGSNLGQVGNFNRLYFDNAPATVLGGALGPWAIANTNDYAGYNAATGVGVVGTGGYVGYTTTFGSGNITNLGTVLSNLGSTASGVMTTTLGNTTTGMLRLNGVYQNDIAFTTGASTLNLEQGGILRPSNAFSSSFGTTSLRGVLTAGGIETSGVRELVVYANNNTNPTFTGATINPNTTVITMSSTQGLIKGMTLANANLPAGTTIVSIDSFTQITVSQPSTNATQQTSQTLTAGQYVSGGTSANSQTVTMNSTVGLMPGMTITGTGIPAGTFIQTVDSATSVTLSQAATADNTGLTFTAGVGNIIVNSVIADNGLGNSLRLVKSGTGILNLSAVNTYTGGTVVDQGVLNLIGTGITIPAGGLVINNSTVTMNTYAGQIDASNAVTLRRGAALNLVGNNTLDSLNFDNSGGTTNPTVVIGAGNTLTLTNAGPVTVLNSNAITTPTISLGTLALMPGIKTFSIQGPTAAGQLYTTINSSLNITSVITGVGTTINKVGSGILQFSAQNTFDGGVTLNQGGILLSASSTASTVSTGLASGPIGTGILTAAGGTMILIDGSRTLNNELVFNGPLNFDTTANTAWTLTLNGKITLPAGALTIRVGNPNMTVSMLGNIANISQVTSITKTGLGILLFNSTGYTGDFNAGQLGNPTSLSIFNDGDGTGRAETIQLGNINFDAGIVPAITIGRAGQTQPYTLAANKILAATSVNSIGGGLTLTNNNGYGLLIPNAATLTGTPTFSVSAASNSNVTQGLYLTGLLSGTGFTKVGLGTVVLGNTGNDFTGNITINQGVVSISDDRQLGNAANKVILAPTTGISTLRATEDVTTSRAIQFAGTANTRAIEVTTGKTLQLNSPFDLNGAAGVAAVLVKNDNGTLAINASNSTWTGAITLNAGAILAMNNSAFGTGTITVSPASGAALQLSGGVTVNNPFTMSVTSTGINTGGLIESISGTNTYSGAITQTSGAAATYGARLGAVLNLTGTYNSPGPNSITFAGAGDINVSSVLNNGTTFNKIGRGTLTLTGANTMDTAIALNFNAGTTVFRSAGRTSSATGTGRVTIDVGATLTLDNTTLSGGNVNNRLGTTRPITFRGGSFNLYGANGATTTETLATPTFSRGLSVITLVDGGNGTNLLFTTSANVPANSQNNGTAPTGTSILFRGTRLGDAAGAGVATIRNSGTTNGFAFNGQNGATGTKNKGLMPYALVDTNVGGNGFSFATGDSGGTTNAGTIANIRALAANEYETANTVTANNNLLLNGSATTTVTANVTAPNSITFDASSGSNVGLVLNQGILFNLSSGGILVRSGVNATISGAGVFNQTSGFSPLNLWTIGNLTISTVLNGGNGTTNANIGIVKAGPGTLTLSTPISTIDGQSGMSMNTYSGQFVINQGTVVLNGGKNTIQANNFLSLNGGTLDLNGNSQQILGLFTDGLVAGAGGTVMSSGSQGHLIINQDNASRSFAGQITGNLKLTRSGFNTLTLYSPQTYTGTSVINAGTTILRDTATLLNTPSLELSYAQLTLDNTGTMDLADRLSNTAPITMRGATLQLSGRAQTNSSESIGAITLAQSGSTISAVLGGTGINAADLSVASLTRAVGGGTVNFIVGGQLGNSARIYLGGINGTATTSVGAGLTNNIIGGWAIVNGTSAAEFATYAPSVGVGGLGQTGFAQYSTLILSSGAGPNDNIRVNYTSPSSLLENTTINSLKIDNVVIGGVAIAAGKTLTLASGGFLNFTSTAWNFGGVVNQGFLTSGGPELFIYTQGSGTPTINAIITGNGMSLVKSGNDRLVLAATNTYTGGTFVNGGTLNIAATGFIPAATNPANGLVISGTTAAATVNANAPGAIAASNIVTVNGNGVLNLYGDNALYGIVMNNNGGTANPTVASFTNVSSIGNLVGGASGTLTIGAGGVVATASNLGTVNSLVGRFDFGASPNTISVGSIDVNGATDVAPLQAALSVQGLVGSSGGITKSGAGVLQLSAQQTFSGDLNVAAGGVRIGITNGGSRFSTINLAAGTTLNLAGASTVLGGLAGAGTVYNSGGNQTLTFGFNNASTTFSGQIVRFNDGTPSVISLQKVGTGTTTFTGIQTLASGTAGTITINGGNLAFSGAGRWFVSQTGPVALAQTFTVNRGGTLTLDNSAGNVDGRLGLGGPANDGVAPVAGTFNLTGGTLNIIGSSAAATQEWIGTFNVGAIGGRVDLDADAAQGLRLALTTLGGRNTTGSSVFTGINGSETGTAGTGVLTITTANLVGGGNGANGSFNMNIRPDILADAAVGGAGTGFLVLDSFSGTYRAMDRENETQTAVASWNSTQINGGLFSNQLLSVATTTVNSLTVGGRNLTVSTPITLSTTQYVNGTVNEPAFGQYYRTGALQLLNINGGGVLIRPDLNNGVTLPTVVNMNVGAIRTGNTYSYWHVLDNATLNLNATIFYGGGSDQDYWGFLKTGDGVLNFNARYFTRNYTGNQLTVNGGTLNLSSGYDNTFMVSTAYANTTGLVTIGGTPVNINGAGSVLDLMGKNQFVGALNSQNPLPGYGGTIRTTGGDATFTSNNGGTYGGVLADGADGSKLSYVRTGSATTVLTNVNTYTGSTTIRGGTLQLRDSGSIANSSSISIQYGTLLLDNSALTPTAGGTTRVSAQAPVTMQGGTIQLTPGGSFDNTANFGSMTLTGGANQILPTIVLNQGIQTTINIASLDIRPMITAGGTLHLNGVNAGLGGIGINQGQLYVTQYNGATPTANTWLGPNVIFNNGEYGAYNPTFGFGPLATSGTATNFANYSVALVSGVDTPTAISNNGASFTISANTTTGALRFGTNSDQTISFTAGTEILNLALGGLLQTNNSNTFTIGSTALRGVLTAGGTQAAAIDLVLYNGTGTMNIHSLIRNNNAGAPLRFVKSGAGTLGLSANNTYTGGTVVNQGTVNLNGTGVVIPAGGLVINNATVTQNTNNGQIAATNDVTLNGGAVLNINIAAGSNTLNSLTFNNPGSIVAPAVNLGTGTLTLSAVNAITSINDNPSFVPMISNAATGATAGTGTLNLTGVDPVINVGGSAPVGLTIAATLNAGASTLTKTGTGTLALTSGTAITAGAFNLDQGGIIVGSTGGTAAVLNNPLGTGTLRIGAVGDASITSLSNVSGAGNTVGFGNLIQLRGNLTIGGFFATNSIRFLGNVEFGTGTRTINVAHPSVTLTTVAGAISTTTTAGTDFLVKAGLGTWVIGQAPIDGWNGAGVWIKEGLLQTASGGQASIASDSPLKISAGAGFDLNGSSQTLAGLADGAVGSGGFITNNNAANVTLTLNAATNSTFSGVITDTATGTANRVALTKNGIGTLILNGINSYSGATNVNAGGLIINGTVAAAVSSTAAPTQSTSITVASNATLGGSGVIGTTTNLVGTLVTVAGGANLDFRDSKLDNLQILAPTGAGTNLILGDATAATKLYVDLGTVGSTPTVDQINITGNFKLDSLGATVILNPIAGQVPTGAGRMALITFAAYDATSTRNISIDSSSPRFFSGTEYTLDTTLTNRIDLVYSRIADPTAAYWKGGVAASAASWNSFSTGGSDTNFFTTSAATTNTMQVPGAVTNVFFAADGYLPGNLATTLDANFTINSLNFSGSTSTNPISIAPGSVATNSLTIQATTADGNPASRGITVASGTQSPITISTDIVLGNSQTWLNNGSATLTFSGNTITSNSAARFVIDGSGDTIIRAKLDLAGGNNATYEFAKTGSGKLTLTVANNYGVPTTIGQGILEVAETGKLGNGGGTVTIGDGGILQLNQSNTLTLLNYIKSSDTYVTGGQLKQIGTGTTVLTNNNMDFKGSVTVSQGTLVSIDPFGSNTGGLVATSSVTVGATSGSAVLVASGSIPTLNVQSGGVLSPGASATGNHQVVGRVEVGATATMAAGSTFTFQFLGGLQAVGGTGEVTGADFADQLAAAEAGAWDLLSAVALNLSGVDAGNKINLQVISMSDAATAGQNSSFSGTTPLTGDATQTNTESLHWLFATTSNGVTLNGQAITGDINSYFNIDAGQALGTGGTPVGGSFYVTLVNGTDLYLNYAAVPEPGSLLLMGIAGIGFGLRWRKRRKAAGKQADDEANPVAEGSLAQA
jgi:autotransporter-associated beta strand protein